MGQNRNFEKNAVVKNQGTKQRVQRILGDCWQWETNGQCVKGDNCSFRHTSLDTENHEQNGHEKVYDDNNTFVANVDNCDTTYTDKHMRNM